MAEPAPSPRPLGLLLTVAAALIATALKCAWALNSFGTIDASLFYWYGQALDRSTLASLYAGSALFNHTPLTGCLAEGLYRAAGGDLAAFTSALRFLSILADLGVIAGLLYVRHRTGRPPWWTVVLFALSPVSIMVSGFHGNVDPLMVLFLFGAVLAMIEPRPVWCGLLFALACNIKVMPLLLAPLFLCFWLARGRGTMTRFSLAAAAGLLLGSVWPLMQCPGPYLAKVFGYGTYWGTWGFTYWLHQTGAAVFATIGFRDLSEPQRWVAFVLKCLMVAAVLAFAWRRRKVTAPDFLTTLTAAFAAIFSFAPGVGPQYLVWFAPFLAWSSPRWYAAITACSAAFMAAFYHSSSGSVFPWELSFPKGPEIAVWGPWMNLPWLALAALLATHAARWWRPAASTPGGTPAAA